MKTSVLPFSAEAGLLEARTLGSIQLHSERTSPLVVFPGVDFPQARASH